MSSAGNALGTNIAPYPIPRPAPQPKPQPAPAPAPTASADTAGANLLQADQGFQTATNELGAAEAKQAELQGRQKQLAGEYQQGQDTREEAELRKLDQGPFMPKQDSMAEMGSMFMLIGMAGAFLGGKGGGAAAANAQAALNGIVDGWNKGDEQEVARQKAVYDENANYLNDKAQKVKEIFQQYREDALKYGIPTAEGKATNDLLTKADANVLYKKAKVSGMQAAMKAAEDLYKVNVQAQTQKANLEERYFQAQEAHADRMAAIQQRREAAGSFTPDMGDLMAALAERGVSLPTGLRSRQQQAALYQGLLARHPGASVDQIADQIKSGQIDLKAELKETQTAAGIAGRVGVATEEMGPMGDLVLQAAAKVSRTSFMPINKLLRTGQEQLLDPNLRDLKIKINALLNAYDVLAARGGTDMSKREYAHKLLTDADNMAALQAGVKALAQEGEVAKQAATRAEHKYDPNVSRETDVTQEQYSALKKGDKYWFGGKQYTKE